jgi:hypothetical protein
MSDGLDWERQLMAAADALAPSQVDLAPLKQPLQAWLTELTQALAAHTIEVSEAGRTPPVLAVQASQINALLINSAPDWQRKWAALEPARHLAQTFEDRVMLLVYGKFNAGKSSLCNLLAQRFAAHGKPVQRFHVQSGRIVESGEPLAEGAVETTAQLQGVCLGAHLMLLDTPGLHSATLENATLTQRFADSADAVLWLTSSTSPGQVQELDGLARELHRGKPLLPVITRSDVFEEDEVEGEIVKRLRNKSPANRLLQEQDVQARGQVKLRQMGIEEAWLKPPVSVSVHMAREQGETAQALGDSGFGRLGSALLDIVRPAIAYKQRKPAELMLHHLEEHVLEGIASQLQPALVQLASLLQVERTRLQDTQPRLVRAVVREVLPALPALMDRYAPEQAVAALCSEIDQLLRGALVLQVQQHIGDHALPLAAGHDGVYDSPLDELGYEPLYDALAARIQASIARQVELAVGSCHRALDLLHASILTLQTVLAGRKDSLMHLKRQLRDGVDRHPVNQTVL